MPRITLDLRGLKPPRSGIYKARPIWIRMRLAASLCVYRTTALRVVWPLEYKGMVLFYKEIMPCSPLPSTKLWKLGVYNNKVMYVKHVSSFANLALWLKGVR